MLSLQFVKAAPAGAYIAFGLALFVWHVGATLLGALIADRLGIGDDGFNLKDDLKKTAASSLVALSLFLSLFYFTLHPAVFLVYLLCLLFSLKLAYLNANHGFLLTVLGSGIAGMISFVPLAAWLTLRGIFLLYLGLVAVFLFRHLRSRRSARERRELDNANERQARDWARRDPGFATPCYQCLFHADAGARCQLKNGGEAVREITIDRRTLCTSFKAKG